MNFIQSSVAAKAFSDVCRYRIDGVDPLDTDGAFGKPVPRHDDVPDGIR